MHVWNVEDLQPFDTKHLKICKENKDSYVDFMISKCVRILLKKKGPANKKDIPDKLLNWVTGYLGNKRPLWTIAQEPIKGPFGISELIFVTFSKCQELVIECFDELTKHKMFDIYSVNSLSPIGLEVLD